MTLPVGSEFFPKRSAQPVRDRGLAARVGASIEQTDTAARSASRKLVRALSPSTDAKARTIERLRDMRTLVGGGGARWYLGAQPRSAEVQLRRAPGPHDGSARLTSGVRRRHPPRRRPTGTRQLGIEPRRRRARDPARADMMGPAGQVRDRDAHLRAARLGSPVSPMPRSCVGAGARALRPARANSRASGRPTTPGARTPTSCSSTSTPTRRTSPSVTNASASRRTLNAYFTGYHLTTFREDGPPGARVPAPPARCQRDDRRDAIGGAFVRGASTTRCRSIQIAEVDARFAPAKIDRRYLLRRIDVSVRATERRLPERTTSSQKLIESPRSFKQWEDDAPDRATGGRSAATLFESQAVARSELHDCRSSSRCCRSFCC